jgi:hypothetical protein
LLAESKVNGILTPRMDNALFEVHIRLEEKLKEAGGAGGEG